MTPAGTSGRLALSAASLLLVTGCGDGTVASSGAAPSASPSASASISPSDAPEPTPRSEPSRDVAEVPATLRFEAETVAGEPFSGATLAGRPALLWFWAPWCPTCRGQVPQVQGIVERFGDDVSVVGVGSLDSGQAIADFAGDVTGPTHLTDTDGSVWRHFGVVEQSSFVLLDAGGEVVFEAGYGGADDLADRIQSLVG